MKEGRKEGTVGREGKEGRVTGVMIWATALLLPLALPPGGGERENARAHGHARSRSQMGWVAVNQRGTISPSLLPPSFVLRATLGAALSLPIRTDDDVAVKLVGSEGKDLQEGNVRDGLAHGKRDHHEICESRVVQI